ncbi:protein FliS [Noviherbaspirillum suwonense]|uniref:Protein FliS n=1 Tax=Noviherbaspirillum suwonense TaxID=1224511 RepID=A0ABY1PU52_9BURK|nr:protein FliS [Noviherbaspirillum suwonense]
MPCYASVRLYHPPAYCRGSRGIFLASDRTGPDIAKASWPANVHASLGLETGVAAAGPHKPILMLFDGALTSLAIARVETQAKNIAAKGRAISRTIRIIEDGFRSSLAKSGGAAQRLQACAA